MSKKKEIKIKRETSKKINNNAIYLLNSTSQSHWQKNSKKNNNAKDSQHFKQTFNDNLTFNDSNLLKIDDENFFGDKINNINDDEKPNKRQSPLTYFLIFFVIFLLIAWIIPSYTFKKYQDPKNIPKLSSLKISSINYTRYNFTDIKDIYRVVNNPNIKDTSDNIAVQSCNNGNRLCYAKSLYYFVRDNIKYINDPVNKEYIENPMQVLASGGADCESGSALLVSMLRSIGINADFVFIPNHAFVKAILPEAPRIYKKNGNIVYLDWTCKSCKFGELPPQDQEYLQE